MGVRDMYFLEKGNSIIIWGSGKYGSYVIENYSDQYEIKFIVDNKVKGNSQTELKNIPVYNPSILLDRKQWGEKTLLVLCMSNVEALKRQIEEYKLKIFQDFIPWYFLSYNSISIEFLTFLEDDVDKIRYIKALAKNKKICALYGMCHMSIYRNFLLNSEQFLSKYIILDIPTVNDRFTKYHDVLKSDFIWKCCDLVITSQISSVNLSDVFSTQEILKKTNKDCKKIVVTNAAFKGYFLQHTTGIRETAQYFGWGDKNINRMIIKGKNYKDIEDMILEQEYYEYEYINKYFDKSLKILEEEEKECDIKICDYIKENGRSKVLFYSWTHPTDEIMVEIGKRIFEKLGLDTCIFEEHIGDIRLNTNEELIYPCVLKTLGIVNADNYVKERKMNPGHLWKDNLLTYKEYIKEYILMNSKYIKNKKENCK